MNKDALFKHVAAMGDKATNDWPTPIPNCPQPETPIRDRAWTDEQLEAIQDLLELVEDEHGGDHTEADCRHCRAANLLAAIGATP